jgi:predicted GNAT family N-acyltransferase
MEDWFIGFVDPESEAFLETVDLRYRELREPLGLDYTDEQIKEDSLQQTMALSNGQNIIAVLMLKPINDQQIKVRQVAVDRDFQGKGLGRRLSEHAEEFARNAGYTEVVLHARKTAVGFYQKMDYLIDSEEFTEVGIPHHRMKKSL